MVKSEKIYTPWEYLQLVLGDHITYNVCNKNDIEEIKRVLMERNHYFLWDYPLSELDHIVEAEINVVLVKCSVWNEKVKKNGHVDYDISTVYRWFEVPEDFKDA